MIDPQSPWSLSALREIGQLKPDMSAAAIAAGVVSAASEAELREFATAYVTEWVDALRRADAREVEKAAVRLVEQEAPTYNPEARFEQWLSDPIRHWHISNNRDRAAFKRWAGHRFEAWHEVARKAAEAEEEVRSGSIDMFEGDWHPDGVMGHFREKRNEEVAHRLKALVDTVSRDVRLETTRELLETMFSLGDGRRVSWGDATVADHRQRIGLLVKNAVGVTDTATRHAAAIRMIEEAGASRLADLAVAA